MSVPEPNVLAPKLLLASASPRRKALLHAAGLHFEVRPARIDERWHEAEAPAHCAERLASAKALAVAREADDATLILAADTVVALHRRILGKPQSREEAARMLRRLSGAVHQVFSGVALASSDGSVESFVTCSSVRFHPLSEEEITEYVASGEGADKAGGYAIQGRLGRKLVAGWRGSFTNVVGLPLAETLRALARHGVRIDVDPSDLERRIVQEAWR